MAPLPVPSFFDVVGAVVEVGFGVVVGVVVGVAGGVVVVRRGGSRRR
ncbi:hypothetical protein [Streptomyces sp. NPDC048516]